MSGGRISSRAHPCGRLQARWQSRRRKTCLEPCSRRRLLLGMAARRIGARFGLALRSVAGARTGGRPQRSDTEASQSPRRRRGAAPAPRLAVGEGALSKVGIPGVSGGQGRSPAVAGCLGLPERKIAAVAEERSQSVPSLCEACSATPPERPDEPADRASTLLMPGRGVRPRPCRAILPVRVAGIASKSRCLARTNSPTKT